MFADRERPYVVVAESDSGAAIIPACIRDGSVSFLGEELFDYRDVLANDADCLYQAWMAIDALGLPVSVKATRREVDWGENQPFAGAPFRPRTSSLARNKKMERNLTLLSQRSCVFTQIDDREKAAFVRRMYMLKGQQPSGSLFVDPLRAEAVVAMSALVPSAIYALIYGDDIVAASLIFRDGFTCRFYGIYYDPHWAAFSPGICLLYRLVKEAQSQNLDFDFMTGEQPYKLRFATESVPLFIAKRRASHDVREAATAA